MKEDETTVHIRTLGEGGEGGRQIIMKSRKRLLEKRVSCQAVEDRRCTGHENPINTKGRRGQICSWDTVRVV